MRMFCSVILLLNMLISNMKKLKKHNFKKKFVGKFVFHETKKVNSLRFVVTMSHYTAVAGNLVNILLLDFNIKNIFNYKSVQKSNFTRIWNHKEKWFCIKKWSEWASKSGQFAMLIVNHLVNAMVSVLKILLQNTLRSNRKKMERPNFEQKSWEVCFLQNKKVEIL